MKWSLDQLRTFTHVADLGGFSRAGERLFLAQSTVSWQVQQLERQIGAPLLYRTPNGVTLTEKGHAFYLRAEKVITANDEAEQWVTESSGDRQIVRFATTDCYATCLLPGLLELWKSQFPTVQVSLDCSFSTDIWKRYKKGEFDIALAQHCPSGINAEPIRVEPLVWVCSRRSQAWKQSVLPVALFEYGCPDREIILNALKGVGREYRVEVETYSYGGLIAAVESGAVISALPKSTIPPTLKLLDNQHSLPPLPSLNVNLASPKKSSDHLCNQLYDAVALHLTEYEQSLKIKDRELLG